MSQITTDVYVCEVEHQPCNHMVPQFDSCKRMSAFWLLISPHILHQYWCSFKETKLKKIIISCNLFLNLCKTIMYKLKPKLENELFAFISKISENFFHENTFIFQLMEYTCNNKVYDIFFLDIPRISLEHKCIFCGVNLMFYDAVSMIHDIIGDSQSHFHILLNSCFRY